MEDDGRSGITRPGDMVLLDINEGDRYSFSRLSSSGTIKIGNAKCELEPLVGAPYGAIFEVQRGKKGPVLARVLPSYDQGEKQHEEDVDMDKTLDGEAERDNRNLVDNNTAQKLSSEDIAQLRRDGATGQEIIDALIANSATFETKTAFSQEKYKRKKQKKYAPQIVLRRPTAFSVCEAYFLKSPQKIGHLRVDMLALLLSLGNVGSHANVMVVDRLGGLLTAAVAERMGGFGSVCSVYHTTKYPSTDIVGHFNFSEHLFRRVRRASLTNIVEAFTKVKESSISQEEDRDIARESQVCDGKGFEEGLVSCTNGENVGTNGHEESEKKEPQSDVHVEAIGENSERKDLQSVFVHEKIIGENNERNELQSDVHEETVRENSERKELHSVFVHEETVKENSAMSTETEDGSTEVKEGCDNAGTPRVKNSTCKTVKHATSSDLAEWARQGFTNLVVGAPDIDTWSIIDQLWPILCPSSAFAIYNPYLQPLAECMNKLQANRMAVALQISEPWLREYQVLPSRTHPHMQMSTTGGYVLSGIKVIT